MARRLNRPIPPLLIAGALSLCVCVTAGAAETRAIALTESQNGTRVEIAKDQELEIRLPVQGGTGFTWELASKPSAPVDLVIAKVLPANDGSRPGGSQTQLFTFKPNAGGAGDIELGYRRPWEKNTRPARKFTVHLVVRDAAP